MTLMEDVFFSFTFGGETLSLAAAQATLKKLTQYPVIKTMWEVGDYLETELNKLIVTHQLQNIFKLIIIN